MYSWKPSAPVGLLSMLTLDRFDKLRPDATPGLDVICNGILQGVPFVMGKSVAS